MISCCGFSPVRELQDTEAQTALLFFWTILLLNQLSPGFAVLFKPPPATYACISEFTWAYENASHIFSSAESDIHDRGDAFLTLIFLSANKIMCYGKIQSAIMLLLEVFFLSSSQAWRSERLLIYMYLSLFGWYKGGKMRKKQSRTGGRGGVTNNQRWQRHIANSPGYKRKSNNPNILCVSVCAFVIGCTRMLLIAKGGPHNVNPTTSR